MEDLNKIKKIVTDYYDKHESLYFSDISDEDKQHVISIGVSLLCTKWDKYYAGGSFVKSIINNDLRSAVDTADLTNLKYIPFYVRLIHNVEKPIFLS